MVTKFLIFLINCYKKYISPLLGNNCIFYPTCSSYAIKALQIHGPLKGVILTAWRIIRCNPLGKGGIEYVPKKGKWKSDKQ